MAEGGYKSNLMRVEERLLKYVKIWTTSDEASETVPSTSRQFDLAKVLVEDMKEIGIADAYVDDKCYVYGHIPATPGYEEIIKVGFIGHMDTAPDLSGENVNPQIIRDYDGQDIVLGDSGRVIRVADFPHLADMKGRTIICTDGTTLLGADDKAGVAEILAMAEQIIREEIPHGQISIAFTPDEEIGRGADCFDVEAFDAQYAYTMDGDLENEINFETFNATTAIFEFKGINVHPGSAKDIMVNAQLVAMELANMLPKDETPATTEGYEGFYHMTAMEGGVEHARLTYIVRDHDAKKLLDRKAFLQKTADEINAKYGEGTVTLTLKDAYRNMAEILKDCMFLIEDVKTAMEQVGLTPNVAPIRGGTDGAVLSFKGLPCPNIGTGGAGYHGACEHISVEGMEKAQAMLIGLIHIFAEK